MSAALPPPPPPPPAEVRLVDHVDPFHGAITLHKSSHHGLGKTIPGPTTPFGLVQPGPDTITGGDNTSGYSWLHDTIEGFSLTHMNGTGWYGEFGNFLVTPTSGPLRTARGKTGGGDGYRSRFRKETETAAAGYYAVTLDDHKVRAELTAAPRAAFLRFTFDAGAETPRVQVDLSRRVGGTAIEQAFTVTDARTVEGWMRCTPDGGGWGDGAGRASYTLHFVAQFDRDLARTGAWSAQIPDEQKRKNRDVASDAYQALVAAAPVTPGAREARGKHVGFYAEFPELAERGGSVQMRVGLSFVDVEGARQNLAHDLPHWDFSRARADAEALWERALGAIRVRGGTPEQRTIFYTSLYRSMIDPRTVTDVDGRYVTHKGEVRRAEGSEQRTVFSGWDVFRSQFPLQTLINPRMVAETINSLMRVTDEGGSPGLARWEMLGRNTNIMLGDPALSVIADAIVKDLPGFDRARAYGHVRGVVFGPGNKTNRRSWSSYTTLGYVPGRLSDTLENAYGDYAAGVIARELGHAEDAKKMFAASKNYRNVFDPSVGWFRAKDKDGAWLPWEGREKQLSQGSVESNPWQQGWFVPHDVPGFIELLGGREKLLAELNGFFEATPKHMLWNDAYNHANEPVHHVPFMFTAAGTPWLTQKWSRFILDHAYKTGPQGLVGNEDCGQLSAWYVLTALGLHPLAPGDGRWIITSPIFERAELRLAPEAGGKTFTVATRGNGPGRPYIRAAKLNGKPLDRAWLHHREVAAGGVLELEMSDTPDESWGAAHPPPSGLDATAAP